MAIAPDGRTVLTGTVATRFENEDGLFRLHFL
jgi:hypothetical protein